VLVPPPDPGKHLSTLYATHTMSTPRGEIYITFSGAYNLSGANVEGVDPMSAFGTWVKHRRHRRLREPSGTGLCQGFRRRRRRLDLAVHLPHGRGDVYWAK
jgi:hypothetical protein